MKKQNSIDSICFHASFWPALGLVTLSIIIAITLFLYQLDSIKDREQHRHELISELFIKSGNADIIIGNEHALYVMLQEYKSKYLLDDIRIESYLPESKSQKLNWLRVINSACPIPGITPARYVIIESKMTNKDLVTPLLSSFAIIILFVITSLIMFERIKQKLNEQIIIPLGQTLKCDGNELEWFNQDKAAIEISALYQRTHQFIKQLHEQRDVIEASNIKQAKYDVALQMAHDIRSPVMALETITLMFEGLENEAKIMLQNVTKRIAEVASDILERNLPRDQSKSSTIELIKSIFHEKKLSYSNRKIQFKLTTDNFVSSASVRMPDTQFVRILSNIINNSIEATYESCVIEVQLFMKESDINIVVIDNGCGMSPEILQKLFTPNSISNKINGNNLALANAYKLILKHNGSLEIQSTTGKGTRVHITLPLL